MKPFVFQGMPDLPGSIKQRAPRSPQERAAEFSRITPRLLALINEHRRTASSMKVSFSQDDICCVLEALREHARNGEPKPQAAARDEIHGYMLQRLFEELAEEPSNIFFTTQTGPDSVRYDAMESAFWLECLNELEKRVRSSAENQS